MRRKWYVVAAVFLPLALLLRPVEPRVSSERAQVLDRDGELLFGPTTSGHVRIDGLSEHVVPALVAVEDHRFFVHPGIDPIALGRAVTNNLSAGHVVSGASTLSMQAARLLRGRSQRGVVDKLAEMLLAVRLEIWRSKEEILEIWLNEAYFGRGAYGIEAASRAWFGKSAKDISLAEAAFLVGIPQRPSRGPEGLSQRQSAVLEAMEENEMVEPGSIRDAAAQQLSFAAPPPRQISAAHVSIGLSFRSEAAIRTTLHADLQRTVERLARAHTQGLSEFEVGNVAALVVDNSSGAILAYLGSADYFDDVAGGANDGITMLRQPGSSLKPFIYGAAFDRGLIDPASVLQDVETPFVEAGAAFSADIYDQRYHGPVPARQALASSYNVPAVALVDLMGAHQALASLRSAGFVSLRADPEHYGVGLALGNGEVSLLELAQAYTSLARGGEPAPLHVVQGEPLLPPAAGAFPADVAFLLTDILSDPQARAPAFGRGGPLETPFPMAAKTGTSKDYRDNWAVGVTPGHTVAVWAGNFDGQPMRGVDGVSGAGTLLNAIATVVGGSGDFPRPEGVLLRRGGVHSDLVLARHQTAADQDEPESQSRVSSIARSALVDRLTLRYPVDGMVFQLDPVLRPEFQQIRLRAAVPEGWTNVRYEVNGLRLAGELLPLTPETHAIAVLGTDPGGVERRSRTATIRVLALNSEGIR